MIRFTFLILLFLARPIFSVSQCAFTIEPVPSTGCMESRTEAVFTDLVRTTANGNSVLKTSGNSSWNAGALSTSGILNNGFVEATSFQTNKDRAFGLSHSNNLNNNEVSSLEYAITFGTWGWAEVKEFGVSKAWLWFSSIGDKFKIAVEEGVVKYYQNNNLVYVSDQSPTVPLYVDLAFADNEGEIRNVWIVNKTGTTIRAFTAQSGTTISAYKWFKNNIQLPFSGAEITLSNFSNGDVIKCIAIPTSGSCAGLPLQSNSMILKLDGAEPDIDFNISATPADQACLLAMEDVVWQANIPENITISNGSITKINGYNTSNGGVYSKNIVANNGYLEFQTGEINTRKMVGLSATDGGSLESSIQFAFYIESGGNLTIYESGSWKAGVGNISTESKLRIFIDNGVVKYYRNQELLYVSEKFPNLPLIADGTIQNIGSTIKNAVIVNPTNGQFTISDENQNNGLDWKINSESTGQSSSSISLDYLEENDVINCIYSFTQNGCGTYFIESNQITILKNNNLAPHLFYIEGIPESGGTGMAVEQVVWNPSSLANVSNIDNNLTKVQGNGPFNAGASSLNTVKNNGYFDFTVSEKNKSKAIGLSFNDPNYNYNTTDYALVLGNGKYTIYESGIWKAGNKSFKVGDVLRIAVENNVVKYYTNQTLVYTSSKVPNLPLLVDISLAQVDGTVQNAVIGNKNERKFIAHVTGLGASPILEWYINGNPTGNHETLFQDPVIENNDIITCSVIPDFSGCSSETQFTSNYIKFTGIPTRTDWLGGVSTSWHDPANWSEGIPNAELSARIPAGRIHQPLISSSQSVKNILVEASAKLTMTGNVSFLVYGDFSINGEFNPVNGTIIFKGSSSQKIKGSNLKFNKLNLNLSSSDDALILLSPIYIISETIFTKGKIKTMSEEVVYLDGSNSRDGHQNSFIDGRVRKIGKDQFKFPIGSGNLYAPLSITAPKFSTDEFTAEYFNEDPNIAGFSTESQDGSFASASVCEYWMLNRISGNCAVQVSLSYDETRSCVVADPSFLQIAHWNGELWENIGLSNLLINEENGMISSQGTVSDFSPFTIGSASGLNPLPVELSSFSAEKRSKQTNLEWVTDSEKNNSYFTLERSTDAINFYEIARVAGAGSSRQKQVYNYEDNVPKAGINYYRLSQTDFDGAQTYFDIKSVYFEYSENIVIYPNPNEGVFTIVRANENPVHMRILDANGKTLWMRDTIEMLTQVSVYHLPKGIYYLHIDDGQHHVTEKIVIQ